MAFHNCSFRPMDECRACEIEQEAWYGPEDAVDLFHDDVHDPSDDVADEYEWRQAELGREDAAYATEEAYQTWLTVQHDEFLQLPDPGANVPA